MEQVAAFLLATVLQLPVYLALASPWLLLAWALAALLRPRVSPSWRVALASGSAAVGLAPSYGAHLSMAPAYTLVGTIPASSIATSALVTWLATFAVARAIYRSRHMPPPSIARSNPSLHLTFASRLRRLSPAGELKR